MSPPAALAPIAPAFRSRRHAALFSAGVLFWLVLPALLSAFGLYRRRDAYEEVTVGEGAFLYDAAQIFDETSDVDMLVIGDSMTYLGVDARSIQDELSRAQGHEARVRTFAHTYPGLDLDYALLRDLLAHRHLKTLAIALPRPVDVQERPHYFSYHFLPFGDDPAMVEGLPFDQRATLYFESVLGAPRHLVSLVRRAPILEHAAAASLGTNLVEAGYEGEPYAPVRREPPVVPVRDMIESPASIDHFVFTQTPLTPYQAHFLRRIVALVKEHGVRLVAFHVVRFGDRHEQVITERFDWPKYLGVEGALVDVVPSVLFAGMTEDEIRSLYSNEHFNAAGARFFTRTIAPALVEAHLHVP